MSIESPKEYKVPPQDQECKVPSQGHRPSSQNDVDTLTTSTVLPKYPCYSKCQKGNRNKA